MMKLGSNVISQWQLEQNPWYSRFNWKNWRRSCQGVFHWCPHSAGHKQKKGKLDAIYVLCIYK